MEVVDRGRMASAAVGEAGGHSMQAVQMVRADVILIKLGAVAGEVLTGRCSGSASEVEAAVLEMRWARSAFSVEEAAERNCDTAGHGC